MTKVKHLLRRKRVIYVTITAFLAFVLAVFLYSGISTGRSSILLRAVPAGAGAVLALPDAGRWARTGDSLVLPVSLRQDIVLFREALVRLEAHSTGSMVLFLEQRGPEGPALGAILEWRGSEGALARLYGSASAPRRTRFRGQQIFTVDMGSGRSLTVARQGKVLILGRFPFLVESVIGHLRGDRGPLLLPRALRQSDRHRTSFWLPAEWLGNPWQGPAGWLRATVHTDAAGLYLQGRFHYSGSDGPLPWLTGSTPGNPGAILQVIPEAVSRLQWRHCGQPAAGWPEPGKGKDPVRQQLLPVAAAEQVYAVSNLRGKADRFWILETRDERSAAGQLDRLAPEAGLLEDYDYQTYRIRRLQTRHFRPPGGSGTLDRPFFVQLDRFVIFADSGPALEGWVDQYLVGATLARSATFLEFLQANPAPAHAWWIARPAEVGARMAQQAFRPTFASLTAHHSWTGIKWEAKGLNRVYFHGHWPRLKEKAAESHIKLAWRVELGAPARTAPQVLTLPDQGSVVAIQDSRNRLYLFDGAGQAIWTQRLDGPVHTPVATVDHYRDGQRQLLFNTPGAVHLLDLKTGRETGGFPLRLQSPAINPLTLVDSTGRGDYAFYVACANGNIYGYDLQGLPVKGWGPVMGVGEVKYPLLHFQQEDKDFMVVLNQEGTLFVFRRDGRPRFPPQPFNDTFPSPPAFQVHPASGRIVAVNQDGLAFVVSLSGESFRLRLQSRPVRPVHFAFADVSGDSRNDYIVLSGRNLAVQSYQGEALRQTGSFTFSHAQSDVFTLTLPEEPRPLIGTVDTVRQQIHLMDTSGKLLPGFPLAGSTRFTVSDMYGNGRRVLLVADGEVLYAYGLE